MPRDIDRMGRVDRQIEQRVTLQQESWYKECQGQASGNARRTNGRIDADKERKVIDYTGVPRDGSVRERCNDQAKWHGWDDRPEHGDAECKKEGQE